jgi:hypothetical protein
VQSVISDLLSMLLESPKSIRPNRLPRMASLEFSLNPKGHDLYSLVDV